MNKCKDCKYFGSAAREWCCEARDMVPTKYHACDLIKHGGGMGGDLNDHTEKALAVDGSGYFATLRVKEDFGCVEFKEKPHTYEVDQPGLPKMSVVHHPLNIETKVEEIKIADEEKTVNDDLQTYVRKILKEGLSKCSEASQLLFKRMYSHENLDADINDVVDLMPADKLDWATYQVQRTLGRNDTLP